MGELKYPVCFRQKKSQMIYGYLKNGFCLVAQEKKAMIFLSSFHSEFSTFEMYEKHIRELKEDNLHNEITTENFDKTLSRTFDNLFTYHETDILNVSLSSVQKKRVEAFGYYQSKTNKN